MVQKYLPRECEIERTSIASLALPMATLGGPVTAGVVA